ncbi:Transmembrane osmosensor [Coelomomyces lativittatus]|nr:Transmembrane osmosensor [Coelomomyces lativittatus]KAJ1512474.1 Transmembrane osmosensor [Coelomomyces lativittatus]
MPSFLQAIRPITSSLYLSISLFLSIAGWFIAFVALIFQSSTVVTTQSWVILMWLMFYVPVFYTMLLHSSFPFYRSFLSHTLNITFIITAFEIHLSLQREFSTIASSAKAEASGLILLELSVLSWLLYVSALDAPLVQRLLGGGPSKSTSAPQLPPPTAPLSPIVLSEQPSSSSSAPPRQSLVSKLSVYLKKSNANTPSEEAMPSRPAPMLGSSNPYAYKAKALFAYKGNEADPEELSFNKDEILEVASPQGNRWWQAKKKNGQVGIAPSNYLQLL